ncbi:GIY-YIG nuclease family protein [Salmonella enterica subsp. enterica serovar Infantis]|nr:GIY-YIG nuclease family protein [Salmonella enterica subsp. enterica serovar Infantis]
MSQICYVITNPAWPEWVKIGFTSKSEMKTRLSTYQTGTPFRDFEVYHEVHFDDAKEAEKEVHKRLKQMNATRSPGTEWFKIPKKLAANMIDGVADDLENGLL